MVSMDSIVPPQAERPDETTETDQPLGQDLSSTPLPSIPTPLKKKLKLSIKSLIPSKKKFNKTVNPQTASPFFARLPSEIREQIWKYALSPSTRGRQPHFHIYDTAYDSCTYQEVTKRYIERRKNPTQMSLLLTCRAVYHEAQHLLYDQTHFTLVLFAGKARPGSDLKKLNCIGKLSDCRHLLLRMKKMTIVVQPGERPNLEKYEERILQLFQLFDFGRRLTYLCLQFNFRQEMVYTTPGVQKFLSIVHAFCRLSVPLAPRLESEALKLLIKPCQGLWPPIPFNGYDDILAVAYQGLKETLPGSELRPSYPHGVAESCISRGAYGEAYISSIQRRSQGPTSRGTKVLEGALIGGLITVFFLGLPATVPWAVGASIKRKKDKGEW